MPRISAIDPASAAANARPLLDAARAQLGAAPNFIRVLAHSPKALEGFLGLHGAAAGFAIDNATRERIALTVAEGNACQYCVAAHTAIGRHAGLSEAEMQLNRRGTAGDARDAAAVALARAINDNLGEITDREFDAARDAGLGDAELVEIITLVALNIFTNLIGKATRVEIDFPRVALLPGARAA
ncbi:MAG: carboxymuconolactone decarboxylase family protein [Gammaproteobacteria bacterium]